MSEDSKPGFVAIFRKIQDHWIWTDPDRFQAWVDILMSAQFADSEVMVKGKLVKVPRGTWFISLRKLQARWGWSRPKVSLFLSILESEQMIDIKKTTVGTLIKVRNYEVYQNPDNNKKAADVHTEMHTDVTADMHSDMHTDVQHNNKGNKGNKVNKKKKTAPPSGWTFSEEEIQKMLREDPNNEEYFRAALKKRDEEGGSL